MLPEHLAPQNKQRGPSVTVRPSVCIRLSFLVGMLCALFFFLGGGERLKQNRWPYVSVYAAHVWPNKCFKLSGFERVIHRADFFRRSFNTSANLERAHRFGTELATIAVLCSETIGFGIDTVVVRQPLLRSSFRSERKQSGALN